MELLNMAEFALQRAKQSGATSAEAYLSNSRQLFIEVRNGRVETMKLADEKGLGLRIMIGQKMGFAFTSSPGRGAVEEIIKQAVANAAGNSEDSYHMFPSPPPGYPKIDLYDPVIVRTPVEEKIELARMMEETARDADPRVRIIESSAYQDAEVEVTLVNTLGLMASYRKTYCGLYMALVAEEGGDNQTGFALDYRLRYDELDARKVGHEATRRAVRLLGARPVSTRKTAILLEPYVAMGFLSLLGPALTAEAVQKGRSFFKGKVDRKVASEKITIIDDGTLPGGIASAPFDGEGVPTSRTVLIKEGVLQCFLHNTYTAAKDGVASTGNGVRTSFKSTPEVGTTTFFIQPGNSDVEELISSTDNGLYITEVMGMHTANPISGDFSVGVTGILIENGQFTSPVRGVAVAGNIQELLYQVSGVGNDLTFFGGSGSPTLRIEQMTVGGH